MMIDSMASLPSPPPSSSSSSSSSSEPLSGFSPILELLFFHKAIRAELGHLLFDVSKRDFQTLSARVQFLRLVYAQHSIAEDAIIFPALKSRAKDVAHTVLLDLKMEGQLFDTLMESVNRALEKEKGLLVKEQHNILCCTEAIHTTLCQHMSKEEELVFPLFKKYFSFDEQAVLVWEFLCSIPLNFIEKFLPWISASLSVADHEQMVRCMYSIVPNEDALLQVILSWLKTGSASIWKKYGSSVNMKAIHNLAMDAKDARKQRKGSKRTAEDMQDVLDWEDGSLDEYPIDDLLLWHNAIRKELMEFAESIRKLQPSLHDLRANLPAIRDKLQFITEIYAFHSAAEDNVVFPGVSEKANQTVSYTSQHQEEELRFIAFQSLLDGVRNSEDVCMTEILTKLVFLADSFVETAEKHFTEEETEVLPLARQHCSFQEQQALLYHSLHMMPLKVLEKVLPWFTSFLNEDEAKYMLCTIQQAAPVSDKALVTLLLRWACKGQSQFLGKPKFHSEDKRSVKMKLSCDGTSKLPHLLLRSDAQESTCSETKLNISKDDCGEILRSIKSSPSFSLCTHPEIVGAANATSANGLSASVKPIDAIFQFHKAIHRDVVYLDEESGKISQCGEVFLRQFTGRFKMLWGLYRAHSNAEDEIVFPALEAKEVLHNLSHSFVIEHEHHDELFKDTSCVLEDLALLFANLIKADENELSEGPLDYELSNDSKGKEELCTKLQCMCKSLRINIDHHVIREELELWPLFHNHFSVQEQDKIVGRIIGITGAEVLQTMIPWVTEALPLEEQRTLFDTWLHATRNTMFDKWLHASFPSLFISHHGGELQSSTVRQDNMPEPGSIECLKMVADYLARNERHLLLSEKDEHKVVLCERHIHKEVLESVDHPTSQCERFRSQKADTVRQFPVESCDEFKEGTNTFKPGWQDIFHMNQVELEAALRKVSQDTSLDPRQRAYLMQNLMTSRWIACQQKQAENFISDSSSNEIQGRCPSFNDQEKGIYGCEHYQRNCKLVAACCGQLFTCRLCHDKASDHVMDRHATKEMMCMKCLNIQPVARYCSTPSCNNYMMATYYCNICKFFDYPKRAIYHCPYCNICRLGKGLGIDYFHCMTCNACMHKSLKSHKCREKGLESNCPICHDFLFTSKAPVKALSCGHYMHSSCFQEYTATRYTCPICCKSLGDMSVYFGMIDALVAKEELPEEYKGRKQDVLCKDCEKKGSAPFHWLYHKCGHCGSYNTTVI